jgi:hypothetical protein
LEQAIEFLLAGGTLLYGFGEGVPTGGEGLSQGLEMRVSLHDGLPQGLAMIVSRDSIDEPIALG